MVNESYDLVTDLNLIKKVKSTRKNNKGEF